MNNISITADEARKNSDAAVLGVAKILEKTFESIAANSEVGKRSITEIFDQRIVNESEITEVISAIKQKGFNVERRNQPNGDHVIVTSW